MHVGFVNYCPQESGSSRQDIYASKTCEDTVDNATSN